MKRIIIIFIVTLTCISGFSQTETIKDTVRVDTSKDVGQLNDPVSADTLKPLIDNHLSLKPVENSLQIPDMSSYDQIKIGMKAKKTYNENLEWVKVVGLYTASVVLNAMGDGFNNSNRKTLGHVCNGASIGLLVASPFVVKYNAKKWYWYLASYVSLRVGLFDVTYNATRGLPLNFTGTTSPTDIAYNKMEIDPNVTRSLCLTLGMSIPIALL